MSAAPKPRSLTLHDGDLPAGLSFGASVAVDTETMGLVVPRDRLCLVQMANAEGDCHMVRFAPGAFDAPRLKALLTDRQVLKIFHFARFDIATIQNYLGVVTGPIYCTKIASRLVRTFTDRHGLKDLVRDLLGVDLAKEQQTSDWGSPDLSAAQLAYAAADVLHLHNLRDRLDTLLQREGRTALAQACFEFLPTRAALDLAGWPEIDIFAHS